MTRFHDALPKHGPTESQQIKLLNSSVARSTQRSDSWFDWALTVPNSVLGLSLTPIHRSHPSNLLHCRHSALWIA
jgi:hypothetical protein